MTAVLQKMWAAVSGMTEKIVMTYVQPVLGAFPCLFLGKCEECAHVLCTFYP
jgi:hypothetical protein